MIQVDILTGGSAGTQFNAKQFPITIGRGAGCALSLSDPGVFDQHFEIRFSPEGFTLASIGEAVVMVNGVRSQGELLRNGDMITAGLAQLQFWLGALPQRGLKLREMFTWLLIAAVGAAQVYLFLRLLEMARS